MAQTPPTVMVANVEDGEEAKDVLAEMQTPSSQMATELATPSGLMRKATYRTFGENENVGGMKMHHVAIVGAGFVGTGIAVCLLSEDVGFGHITLTDVNEWKLEGEILDLEDCGGSIKHATAQEAAQADMIIITAGRGPKGDETRLDLAQANREILKNVIDSMRPIKATAIMLIVTDPGDILTHFAQEYSGLPRKHVFGCGTALDTTRLRVALADKFNVHSSSVSINVLGEHGELQFPTYSCAHISNIPLLQFPGIEGIDLQELATLSAQRGFSILSRKGHSEFGVGMAVSKIVECVLKDKKEVFTVSVRVPGTNVCLSLPCVVGADGIERVLDIRPHLSEEENAKLREGIEKMSSCLSSLV